jgi:hypothetical protein
MAAALGRAKKMAKDNKKLDLDKASKAGYDAVCIALAFLQGAADAIVDHEAARLTADLAAMRDSRGISAYAGPPAEESEEKTQIGDCTRCWCNTCSQLEICGFSKTSPEDFPDAIRPRPCIGCIDGEQFRPRLWDAPPCYKETPGGAANMG